ncbi:hypothetical protein E8E11_006326 [Didymella keratinophila]|nr:hypothetical protein E8E11_006326 [Didymella keratinophila]
MNLDDIVAIRAVRIAHGMHMPEQIHPMSEHEHKDSFDPVELMRREGEETLWNYPFYLDQLLSILGLSGVKRIAREMAIGVAVLHWGALVDGMDVEFVFGGISDSKSSTFNPNGGKRATQLWLLDFDKAAKLRLPRDGK